eukprot:6188730-Pleurochrysis_carterae.AAC.2
MRIYYPRQPSSNSAAFSTSPFAFSKAFPAASAVKPIATNSETPEKFRKGSTLSSAGKDSVCVSASQAGSSGKGQQAYPEKSAAKHLFAPQLRREEVEAANQVPARHMCKTFWDNRAEYALSIEHVNAIKGGRAAKTLKDVLKNIKQDTIQTQH